MVEPFPLARHPTIAHRHLSLVRRIATLGLTMARQRMGQHFLGDAAWRQRILDTLPRGLDDTWLEIGAGHGEMTRLLASRGLRVVAIEADPRLADSLQKSLQPEAPKESSIEVVSGDVLALDLGGLAGGKFRVYGNLPYYITSPILHRLFAHADQIASIHIIIQFEVAARIAA